MALLTQLFLEYISPRPHQN